MAKKDDVSKLQSIVESEWKAIENTTDGQMFRSVTTKSALNALARRLLAKNDKERAEIEQRFGQMTLTLLETITKKR